tara:strand:- start:31276 stop:31509 length:234 start_codon:yes stop_codon:yes gene_type:complete
MFQALSAALGILFWFLKRKKAKSTEDWKDDIQKVNKAIASGDDIELSLAFDRLRVEANSSHTKLKSVGMPRGHQEKL